MSINNDRVKGLARQAEGTIKEAAGKLVGNEQLEAKGKIEQIVGTAQVKAGNIKARREGRNRQDLIAGRNADVHGVMSLAST